METYKIISSCKERIIKEVSKVLSDLTSGTEDYITAWKKLQDVAADKIVEILNEEIPNSKFIIPKSKSTYPDIKIINDEGMFAIDIKCNESSKEPWFDMARLDTVIKERVDKYVHEWEYIIKYDSKNKGKFIESYFLEFREVVGKRNECGGVKYRPYDGKLRPKSWSDFDHNVIYWQSQDEYIQAIDNSLKHRWKENIKKVLLPKLSPEEKNCLPIYLSKVKDVNFRFVKV